ncbi:MAG TPA: bifunctional folylpolyglutamate synthase/dihydrofolate synthase, partial [Thermoanaerobaculia bacterium]|nr:bifunctional folylpolyglutamate synthase/dihydrofolate synthase [Thermoanaerobaculia bacterium]
SPRAASPSWLKGRLGRADAGEARSVAGGLAALEAGEPGAPPLLVAGSLYLVGEVLRLLEGESG